MKEGNGIVGTSLEKEEKGLTGRKNERKPEGGQIDKHNIKWKE